MSFRTYGRNAAKRKPNVQPETLNDDEIPPFKRAKVSPDGQPQSQPASPAKLTKRMLGRSKTDSSIGSAASSTFSTPDNSPVKSLNGRSLARTPSLPIPVLSLPSRTLSESEPIAPRRKSSSARTYAGNSRTYLASYPVASGSLASTDEQDEDNDFAGRESYASLRMRWGVDNSEDDPYPPPPPLLSPTKSSTSTRSISRTNSVTSTPSGSPVKGGGRSSKGKARALVDELMPISNGLMNPLKSITELRLKGESRRFLDDVGYLFEGMQKEGGIGLRRAT